ncbi:MAG TPA: DinB family protein [Mucilaginibacter sp.]|nr:DinB family protein [Mucilaginibacter sp.]
MKKIILFLALSSAFFSTGAYAQFTQSQMIAEWRRAKAYTKEYLDAMPDSDYEFKPTPEIRSYSEQMLHLAWTNYFFAAVASNKQDPYEKTDAGNIAPHTKEATTKAVMDSYDFVISALQSMTQNEMNAMAKKKIDGLQLSNANLYGKAFEHQTHHRGQTTIYLRLKGVTPPAEKLF